MPSSAHRRELDEPHAGGLWSPAGAPAVDRQVAVVVGVDAYGPGLRPLANAVRDATAIAETLRDEYGFHLFPGGRPLLDQRASRETVTAALSASLGEGSVRTRWLLYFAGHGKVVDGRGYLLPADARRDDPGSYLDLPALLRQCQESACGEVLIILDACYAGRALLQPAELNDRIPAGDAGTLVRQLISSGNPDQPVLDGGGGGHSIFTRALLDALQGWAGIHDYDGAIAFADLLSFVRREVGGRLAAAGGRPGGQQPLGGNLVGTRDGRGVVLRPIVPRLPPPIIRDTRSDDPARRRGGLRELAASAGPARSAALALASRLVLPPPAAAGPGQAHQGAYEPVAEVRAAAAAALGALGLPGAIDPLIGALHDEPVVCRVAAAALGRLRAARALPALIDRLAGADDGLFLELADAIAASGDADATSTMVRAAVRRRLAVPFIGPDLPQKLSGRPGRPALAHELARRAGLAPPVSLAEAAAASAGGTRSRHSFTDFLRRRLGAQPDQPGELYQELARLDLRVWLSGAYDDSLARALGATRVARGSATPYAGPGRPVVIELVGGVDQPDTLVVLEEDYVALRADERDRRELCAFTSRALQGKIVIFIGHDPDSPDFALLVREVLNGHLANVDACALLVWGQQHAGHHWGARPLRVIHQDALSLVREIAGQDGAPQNQ